MSVPIWVRNPSCEWLLERIDAGEGIAMAKRTHGIWDHLCLLTTGGWEADDWTRCDQMIFKQKAPSMPETVTQRRHYLDYLKEILDDVVHPPADPRWIETISLDLDYLTKKLQRPGFWLRAAADPRLLDYWKWTYSYGDLVEQLQLENRDFVYAQILTHGVSSLSILELPGIARDRHVVLVGPAKTELLPERWGLIPEHFDFIAAPTWPDVRPNGDLFSDPVLPALQTHRMRHDLLARLCAIECERPLLFLFELGTCAQWLIARLFRQRPAASYLDMGRTLELWFPDSAWPLKKPVAARYRRASRAYFGEARYRELVESR